MRAAVAARCRHRRRRCRLCGGARHRHAAGRSDRGRRHRRGVRPGAARSAGADRLGQMQHRPSGAGGRHRRADQDRARAVARRSTAQHQFRDAQSAHRLRRAQYRGGEPRRRPLDRRRRPCAGQFVRLRRHQRLRHPRAPRRRPRQCGAAAASGAAPGERTDAGAAVGADRWSISQPGRARWRRHWSRASLPGLQSTN